MPTKVNTPTTEALAYPTEDDFKRIHEDILRAESVVNGVRQKINALNPVREIHRMVELTAEYMDQWRILEDLYHKIDTMRFHLIIQEVGGLKREVKTLAVSAAGRRF